MDNSNTLDRLNGQIAALIDALQTAREETARLHDELTACQTVARQREERIAELEENTGLKDMELEDLAVRIEEVLGTQTPDAAAQPAPAADAAAAAQPAEAQPA